MTIESSSYAGGVGIAADNKQFAQSVEVLERKQLLVGSYDPAILTITDNVPAEIKSPDAAAALYGRGSMLHRMAIAAFAGNYGLKTWALPAPEDGAAVVATGTITITGAATETGTLALYVAGVRVPVAVTIGDAVATVATAIAAAVTADDDLPVTAGAALGVATLTAKTKGTFGNDISITSNWGTGEETPAGITVAIVAMSAGATDPDVGDALAGMGTGDAANLEHFTDVNFGWGFDVAASIEEISVYNGIGNDFVGCYSPTVGRPFRCLFGDTTASAAGLAALVVIADAHRTDRTNGVIPAPGSPTHPVELACLTLGIMARLNSTRAEQSPLNQVLPGVLPGLTAEQWTTEYDDRDDAVKNGIGTTLVKSGSLTIQNVLTFYRPTSVPLASNGYRSMRNISIVQNMINAARLVFETEKWSGVSIVVDSALVSNAVDRAKARDIAAVVDELLSLADAFGKRAWIYSAQWTKDKISAGGLVTIRTAGNGFDFNLPVLLSGEGGIFSGAIEFDTSLAIVL